MDDDTLFSSMLHAIVGTGVDDEAVSRLVGISYDPDLHDAILIRTSQQWPTKPFGISPVLIIFITLSYPKSLL